MKSVEDLIKSRQNRAAVLAAFGEVPTSILRHNSSIKAIDFQVDGRGYNACANDGGHTGKLADVFDVSGQSVRRRYHATSDRSAFEISGIGVRNKRAYGETSITGGHTGKLKDAFEISNTGPRQNHALGGLLPALSRFSQNVGRELLLLYTKEGDLVIDPFSGHNSRMELCWRDNRNYAGNDISAEFVRDNLAIAEMLYAEAASDLFSEHFTAHIRLYHGDSRHLPFRDAEGDFTITSPPYWDIEYYGDEPEQLGTGKTYAEFLAGLSGVARENYRVLKPGAFCLWFVNDFRKDGVFYSFHEDTACLLRAAGFVQHDMCIVDLGSPIRAAFAQQVIETKILPKRHEYALVFRKPAIAWATPVTRLEEPQLSLFEEFEIGC